MTYNEYERWQEIQRLISQYDWAVEGFPAPENCEIKRENAVAIRNALVKTSINLIDDEQ